MNGSIFSYSRALRGGNVGLRKEGEREVHMCTVRRSSDVVVATALRGGDAEGICPYAGGEEVSWTGGWPHGAHGRGSARCIGARWEGNASALMAHFRHLQLGQ
jgi:hypothetical protein